jgi:C_GCAxxG_C_C family probable redox protein
VLAVGEYLLGEVDEQTLRISTAFSGGVGHTHQELCGALSGGAMLIGARYGRTQPDGEEARCQQLITDYRVRFLDSFGATACGELRRNGYGANGLPCEVLVAQAARILLDLLVE